MIKKILLFFLFLSCFLSLNIQYTNAETLQQKLERLKSGTSEIKDNQDITVELKLEDTSRKDLMLPIKVIWKNLNGEGNGLKYFGTLSSLEAMKKTMSQSEKFGVLEFSNAGEKVIDDNFKIDLDYNKFNGTLREKRLLYYVQFEFNENTNKYKFVRAYTQDELEKELQQEDEITQIEIKGRVKTTTYGVVGVDVGFYTSEGLRIAGGVSDTDGSYSIKINNFKNVIDFSKSYYLIWQKQGSIENNSIGILSEGKEYKFRNTRDLVTSFSGVVDIVVKLNEKDIVKSESFPIVFTIFIIGIYIGLVFYIFTYTIKTVHVHPYSKKTKVDFSGVGGKRKDKILQIKANL